MARTDDVLKMTRAQAEKLLIWSGVNGPSNLLERTVVEEVALRLLDHPNYHVRQKALYGLARIGKMEMVPELKELQNPADIQDAIPLISKKYRKSPEQVAKLFKMAG